MERSSMNVPVSEDIREEIVVVLADHTMVTAANGGAECECGEWSGSWSACGPERHVADALMPLVARIQADAWDKGYIAAQADEQN